jgi:hypothetical protein
MLSRIFRFVCAAMVVMGSFQVVSANGGCTAENIIFSEIDYDQPGTDAAEFIELRIVAATTLNDCELRLVNGNGVIDYQTIDLAGQYSANQYVVIGSSGVSQRNISIDSCATNCLQNDADGLALVDTSAGGNRLVWFYTYEGGLLGYDPGDGSSNASMLLANNATAVKDDNSNNISVHNGPESGVADCYTSFPNPGDTGPTAISLVSFSTKADASWWQFVCFGMGIAGILILGFAPNRKMSK